MHPDAFALRASAAVLYNPTTRQHCYAPLGERKPPPDGHVALLRPQPHTRLLHVVYSRSNTGAHRGQETNDNARGATYGIQGVSKVLVR